MLPSSFKWRKNTSFADENLIDRILKNRDICGTQGVDEFLHPTRHLLHSPYLLNDMDKAVERIVRSKKQHKHIVIYGDYDVDGITSTSILYMFLKKIDCDVSYYIPDRQTEGYGLNIQAIENINQYADLMITVDTGIAAVEELEYAGSIGIDIIITDHHECQANLPKGYCIINPKRKDSTYPFDALAGVGVTFKLIHAIALNLGVEEMIWEYMDLVALGTVADVVPLIHENRAITYLGFETMQNTSHIGLKALIQVVNEGNAAQRITSNMIAYQVGPRINAAGRLGDAKIGVELLTTQDEIKAMQLAKVLNEENKKRQSMEADIIDQAEDYIKNHINLKKEKVIIVVGKQWHHGVIGIVASKIMSKYYKPTIVLTEEEGVLSGSARSIEGFNIFEVIQLTKEYLLRFGGHEMAAGLSLPVENLTRFRELMSRHADELISEEMLIPTMTIDLELDLKQVALDFCEALEQLEPFGAHNPVPLFSVKGRVQSVQTMGQNDKHLRLTIQQDDKAIQAVGFYKGYLIDYLTIGEEIVVGCEVVKNVWNSRVNVQLRIKDIQSTEKDILKSKYYSSLYLAMKQPRVIHMQSVKLINDPHALPQAQAINVYTEEGFYKIYQMFKNNSKNVNLSPNICYNKGYSKSDEKVIVVNPDSNAQVGTNYEWDYQTTDELFSTYDIGFDHHKHQLVKMIPTHKDCSECYKLLRTCTLETISIHKAVASLSAYHMTEYKLYQILEIFNELSILKYTIEEDKIKFNLISAGKTRLESSKIYVNMQRFSESIIQLN